MRNNFEVENLCSYGIVGIFRYEEGYLMCNDLEGSCVFFGVFDDVLMLFY